MTTKQQVKEIHPYTTINWIHSEQKYVVCNGTALLGKGELPQFAWEDALKTIKKQKNERTDN